MFVADVSAKTQVFVFGCEYLFLAREKQYAIRNVMEHKTSNERRGKNTRERNRLTAMETWKRNDVRTVCVSVCGTAIIFISCVCFSHDSADRSNFSRRNLIKSYLSILGIILFLLQSK